MFDKLTDKIFKGNKNISFFVFGIGGMILIILIIVLIVNGCSSGIKTYSDLENKLISSAEKYYEDNKEKLPTAEGAVSTVSDQELITGEYIKDLSKIFTQDTCSATVDVIKSGEYYLYIPKLICNDYTFKTLKEEITSKVVTSGDGLYNYDENYIFRGEYVNNYIKFGDKIWRIVGIDSNGIKVYLNDEKFEKYVWDDRYNIEKKSDYGKNTYETSRISDSLNSLYESDKTISNKYKKYLVSATWCIGGLTEGKEISSINLCNKTMNSYVGVLEVTDYAKASLEPECKKFDDVQCVNYNYLSTITGINWTLNAYSGNTYEVYTISSVGAEYYKAVKEYYIRPVVYLNSNINFIDGDGSLGNPYIVK